MHTTHAERQELYKNGQKPCGSDSFPVLVYFSKTWSLIPRNQVHWKKTTLDLESRLLKTLTRKNNLDSNGNPLKSRDLALRFKEKSN